MYRLLPLRTLRRTTGVKFDEIAKSDIPAIHGIDRVIHGPNGISPGPIEAVKRPWYMHTHQDDNLLVLQGTRYVDIFCPKKKEKASFIVTPDKVYKNNKLYFNAPAMLVWPSGIFHRIISGTDGSISVNFATRHEGFDIKNNFNIYDLCTKTGKHKLLRNGYEDQPDFDYHHTDIKTMKLIEDSEKH